MKSVRALMLYEGGRESDVMEESKLVLGYELQFLSNDESQPVHKVEVKGINFQDVVRHLQQGDAVLITPKFQDTGKKKEKQYQFPWYFTHS